MGIAKALLAKSREMFRNWACFRLVAVQMSSNQRLRISSGSVNAAVLALLMLLAMPRATHSFGINLIKVPREDKAQGACTLALLRKYFESSDALSGSVLTMTRTTNVPNVQEQILREIHSYEGNPWSVLIINPRDKYIRNEFIMPEKPQCYFLVVENLEDEDLDDIIDHWKLAFNWNPVAQFVVYLAAVEETDEEMTDLMVEVLLTFMNKKIYNVNVIGQSDENRFYYGKTVFPFHPDNNCGNRVIAVEMLDACDYEDEENESAEGAEDEDYDEADENGEEGENNREGEEEEGDEANDNNQEESTENGQNKAGNDNTNNDENEQANDASATNSEVSESKEQPDEVRDEDDAGHHLSYGQSVEDGESKTEDEDANEDDDIKGGNSKENANDYAEEMNKVGAEDDKNYTDGNTADVTEENDNSGKYDRSKDDNYQGTENYKFSGENNAELNDVYAVADKKHMLDKINENIVVGISGAGKKGKQRASTYNDENDIEEADIDRLLGSNEKANVTADDGINNEKALIDTKEPVRTDEEEQEDVRLNNENQDTKDTVEEQDDTEIKSGVGEVSENKNDENYENNMMDKGDTVNNENDEEDAKDNADKVGDRDQKSGEESMETEISNENEDSKEALIPKKTSSSNSTQAQARIQEYFPAKFADKFPRDLSGCPLAAAYRPWEPYIFSTAADTDDYDYGGVAPSSASGNQTSTEELDAADSEDDAYADSYGGYSDNEHGASSSVGGNAGTKPKLTGIEFQLVQTIAERLHMTIDLQTENSNLYLLFQQLIDGEIEMIVGGIDEDPSISQYVSSSIAYHQDDLTWCVAKAKRQVSFFNFLAGFKADFWMLLLIFIITTSLALYMAQRSIPGYYEHYLPSYLSICISMYGIILSQSVKAQQLRLVLRLLFTAAFLMGFFFINTYQSFLISTLTTPHSSHQISHVSEILSNRMTVMGTVENVRHLNKDGEIFKYIREKFQMCYNIVECLNHAADNEHIAVAVSRQHSFYNPRVERDRLYCFDRNENLYVYLVNMLLPKKYHLLHQINPTIQHIIESGHMQKWARDLDMVRMIHEEITRVREDPFKALTLDQFYGAFSFASGLLFLASCIFLLECLVYWCVTKRHTRLRPLRYLHRHFSSH